MLHETVSAIRCLGIAHSDTHGFRAARRSLDALPLKFLLGGRQRYDSGGRVRWFAPAMRSTHLRLAHGLLLAAGDVALPLAAVARTERQSDGHLAAALHLTPPAASVRHAERCAGLSRLRAALLLAPLAAAVRLAYLTSRPQTSGRLESGCVQPRGCGTWGLMEGIRAA